ncbi:S-adenosyl-L-methionine-dependent methyltransferase [Gonapodya prolifera JEL478]|uniref:S-adenosyl-L-methionine-dependent methyltransferase n=1 Tax=Gonapodya prolifera (strain JEL478) TaxID=1344416 RepID=A0A139A7E0_GONPJ|nr:S-adenosyl-L-methionine-dependent methyltransferase [Gonapodya prolifera JEL478]|eukprot:KXS12614.1 S-adenosyl-L-methionine-dependent methyltransferase [Gonapodya prolifera JEL478]
MALVRYTVANPYADGGSMAERGFVFGDRYVRIGQRPEEDIDLNHNTGMKLWEGSIILAEHIFHRITVAGKSVVELGSGTGLVGIVAAIAGAASVVLTDLEGQVDLVNENVERNVELVEDKDRIRVVEVDWTEQSDAVRNKIGMVDLVLASECLYLPHLHAPLLSTMRAVAHAGTRAFLSYKQRGFGEEGFFAMAREAGWVVKMIPQKAIRPAELQGLGYQIWEMSMTVVRAG